jgi:light-regulated signal transduction histidine kinase (bacteriophytochrome)
MQVDIEQQKQLAFYMDMLGHDILNSNQAVLGYLELILSTSSTDKAVTKYVEKAVSHIRTSTILIENIKRLMAAREADPNSFKPADLMAAILRSERDLRRHFPDKKVRLSISPRVEEAFVLGGSFAENLVLNLMVSIVGLDRNEEMELSLMLKEIDCGGRMCWSMTVEDKNARLPPAIKDKNIDAVYQQDSSTAVKMAGLLFAKMMAVSLGGDFDAHQLGKTEDEGSAFVLVLRKAGKP